MPHQIPEEKPGILAEKPQRRFGKGVWAIGAAIGSLAVAAAFGIAPPTLEEPAPASLVQRELPLPPIAESDEAEEEFWREERIQRGDTIGSLLARLQVHDPEALQFLRTHPDAKPLYQLRPGRIVRARLNEDGELQGLQYLTQPNQVFTVRRAQDQFQGSLEEPKYETRLEMSTGEIRSSLFAAADDADLPDAVTTQIADIFSSDIDFYHDLRRGDRFAVVYEVLYHLGEPIKTGRVIAAEFVNKGVPYQAYWYDNPTAPDLGDGQPSGGYYGADGRNLRKAFLRSPLAFSRISSGFTNARFHPVLQTWRAHRGIDYAAPSGTPVRATSDGKVVTASRQGGYGNMVQLQHGNTYSTVYAHLSRFGEGIKAGATVRQGDTIGYVGQTGLASGPHLHYEFRVNDEQRDPLRVALPNAQPIPPQDRPRFLNAARELRDRLRLVVQTRLADAS